VAGGIPLAMCLRLCSRTSLMTIELPISAGLCHAETGAYSKESESTWLHVDKNGAGRGYLQGAAMICLIWLSNGDNLC
jgi:hypothetical protein